MTDEPGNPATRAARILLQTLADLGLRHVVLAPGSRSAPLAYAAAECARAQGERDPQAPSVELHVRIDERSAGFLAVGLARGLRADGGDGLVAVVTTSGSAVANLHPAVLEAHHSGLPLLLLTADRPHELRGTGANQTTEQVGLLEPVRLTLDVPAPTGRPGEDRDLRHAVSRAVAAALGPRTADPGPVHVNLAFREPLTPDGAAWPARSSAGRVEVVARPRGAGPDGARAGRASPAAAPDGPDPAGPTDSVAEGVRTVVVAGDGAGPQARRLAERNGWPLLAEPSSGSRGGPNAIPAYRLLLDDPALGGVVERVVVLGRPTLSRPVQALLARSGVETIVVAPAGAGWPDAARNAGRILTEPPVELWTGTDDGADRSAWLRAWQWAGARAAAAVDAVLAAGQTLTGPAVAAEVAGAAGPADVLVIGSSNPVRDLDLVAVWAEPPVVVANRGLSGIDGTLSTGSGVALALGRPVRALVGDLTFLHDVGGLLVGPLERRPDLQVVVVNDDGGSIFATLEPGQERHDGAFERVFATPHGADLASLCAGFAVVHRLAGDRQDLRAALAEPVTGVSVIEVVVDRTGRRALGERLAAAVRHALTTGD